MLTIHLPAQTNREYYDEAKGEFVTLPDQPELTLRLEHSLAVLSKWEEIHEKPFLTKGEKSNDELYSYIFCMIQSPEFLPEEVVQRFTPDDIIKVEQYINAKMTATWFNEANVQQRPTSETLTAELIMYWMITAGIPLEEAKHYHLQKLFTLIKVFGLKNSKGEKMSRSESARYQAELNRKRREAMGSSG